LQKHKVRIKTCYITYPLKKARIQNLWHVLSFTNKKKKIHYHKKQRFINSFLTYFKALMIRNAVIQINRIDIPKT
jgi:GTPase involved in cell partitioning and DNA repair